MIWHIFKKDFRLLWHFVAGTAVLGWLEMLVVYRADRGVPNMGAMVNLAVWAQVFASGILAATAVQLDAIPGVRQDWLIRPIARRDLLLEKLLFVIVLVQLPMFLGDVAEVRALGLSPGQALGAALLRSLCLLGAFYLPVMAFASITRNFTESVVGLVLGFAALYGVVQVINVLAPVYWRMLGTGVDWVADCGMLLVAIAGALIVLAVQYFRRRTMAARWLTVCAGLLCLSANFIPWQSAFAIQQHFSPQPGASAGLNLQFQPGLGKYRDPSRTGANPGYRMVWMRREEASTVFLPMHVSGLATDDLLRNDLVRVHLIDPAGQTEDLGFGSVRFETPGGDPPYQGVVMPAVLFNKLRDQPVQLEFDYSLTLLHFHDAYGMPALNGTQTIPELGVCETKLNRPVTAVHLSCRKAGEVPSCAALFLEHGPDGKRNNKVMKCDGEYGPFFANYEPDAVSRYDANLPFRDAADQWHMPVDGAQLKESQVVMRFYQPVEHFTRHVSIAGVRLGDWVSR